MTTALDIANSALAELGLPQADTIYGATADATERQLGALLNRVCKELNANDEWTKTQLQFSVYLETMITTTGNLTAGSKVVTGIPDTTGLSDAYAIQTVTGSNQDGLLQASRIVTVDSATQVTLNQAAVSDETAITLNITRDTYALPASFGRYIPDTWWDRTNNWMLIGPTSPQVNEFQLSGIVQTGPRRWWRQIGASASSWRIWPPPFTAGDTPAVLSFEYITLAWAFDIDGVALETMTTDTDVPVFPEHVLVLGLKAAFWRVKGFDWVPFNQEYVEAARRAISQDGSKATLLIGSARHRDDMIGLANVQDGSFPGTGFGD